MDLDGRGGGEDLEVGIEKVIIRIYYIKNNLFSITEKKV